MKRRHGNVLHVAGGERDGRAAAGDEAGDEDDVRAALVQRPLGPLEPLVPLLAAEDPLDGLLADEVADPERDVVADHRARRGREDDEPEHEVARAREVPADDDERLARDEREERVDDGDGEDDEVAPPLAGDPLA